MTESPTSLQTDIIDFSIRLGRHIEKVEQVNQELENMSRSTQHLTTQETIEDPNFRMPFGRYKGEKLIDIWAVDRNYIWWLIDKSDLDIHANLIADFEEKENTARGILYSREA